MPNTRWTQSRCKWIDLSKQKADVDRMNRNSGPTGGCLQVTHLNSKAMSGVEKYSSCKKKAGKKWVIYTNINNIGLRQYLLQVTKEGCCIMKTQL